MSKNTYKIEHKIQTLAKNAVPDKDKNSYHTFSIGDIIFEHWDFNIRDGWLENAWLAKGEVISSNFLKAINSFKGKLWKIVPRIALISQSYIEYHFEPFIVHKKDSDKVFFHYARDRESGGLMFMEKEKQALDELLTPTDVSDEFYYYWNDAVNTLGYSAKLLLMFSALEALARKRNKQKFKKPIDLYMHILGKRLTDKIFAKTVGLRQRLIHGEYFAPKQDGKKNYLDLIHKKVISFFNKKVLSKPLLSEKIVNPQRHFYGSKSEWRFFVKRKNNGISFELKDLLDEITDDYMIADFRDNTKYELVDPNTYNNLLKVY